MNDSPCPNHDRDENSPHEPLPSRTIPADSLLAGQRAVWIEHNGVRYLLRLTRRGRLILTK